MQHKSYHMPCRKRYAQPNQITTRHNHQAHLSRPVCEQLQNAQADAVPSALQPTFQFRYRRHPALMVLHQLTVQVGKGRERYPLAGAGAAPAATRAGGAAQGSVQDGRWCLRAAHASTVTFVAVVVYPAGVAVCGKSKCKASQRTSYRKPTPSSKKFILQFARACA